MDRAKNASECLKFLLIMCQKSKAKHLLIVLNICLVLIEHIERNLKLKIFSKQTSRSEIREEKQLFFLEKFSFLWLYNPGPSFFIAG